MALEKHDRTVGSAVGDVVHGALEIVPARSRIVVAGACSIDQSAFTGESLPVWRNTGDETHSGSVGPRRGGGR